MYNVRAISVFIYMSNSCACSNEANGAIVRHGMAGKGKKRYNRGTEADWNEYMHTEHSSSIFIIINIVLSILWEELQQQFVVSM